jgi:5-formyltetrahydrofolate cyclo-ligase
MTMEQPAELLHRKRQLRGEAKARRLAQPDKALVSRQICGRVAALPEYAAARTVMLYLDFASEVRTRDLLQRVWADRKRAVVPYCVGDRLEMFHLQDLDELSPGTLGILEPRPELQSRSDRKVIVEQLDLIVVPGLAFDPRGGRVGYGKGYYDRLLALVRPEVARVAVAFECQVLPEVPMLFYDTFVDKVVTERTVYERKRPL